MTRDGQKLQYPFVPIPKSICTSDFFHSPKIFILICWMFGRVAFIRRSIPINSKLLELEPGEFLFGRNACSKETGISEQSIRTAIKSFLAQGMLTKVTSKSTNKFTVYRLVWSNFSEASNHQNNQLATISQPRNNHNQEKEIEKENQQQENRPNKNVSLVGNGKKFAAGSSLMNNLVGEAKKLYDALSKEEQGLVDVFIAEKVKKQPIKNLGGLVAKCIREEWYKEQEVTILMEEKMQPDQLSINRSLAQQVKARLENYPHVQVYLRQDFLELGLAGQKQWQIFFHVDTDIFKKQLLAIKQEMNVTAWS